MAPFTVEYLPDRLIFDQFSLERMRVLAPPAVAFADRGGIICGNCSPALWTPRSAPAAA